MSESTTPSVLAHTWDDPNVCPFCTAELDDPGAGFVRHIESSPVCATGFEEWRSAVADDVRGEWSG